MSQKSRVALGPGAASLILIVVVLSLSVLGILSMMSARSDLAFSDRSVAVIEAVYALQNQAERTYGTLDKIIADCRKSVTDEKEYLVKIAEGLPSDIDMEEDILTWEETDGVRTLDCSVRVEPLSSEKRITWTMHQLSADIDGTGW